MSLTLGTAPFGQQPGGAFNFDHGAPKGLLYFEDSPRRVRAEIEGEVVADSRRMKLLHESGLLPVYYFPIEDVREDLLEETDHRTRCPKKGEATHWSVHVGDRLVEHAVWGYRDPLETAPWLEGHVAFYWHKVDRWLEEDEEIFVHARDPYHRVDALESSRHVRVSLNGELLAASRRPRILFETGLPPRYYLPREDVRDELFEKDDTSTRCPYKGVASYWLVRAGDGVEKALVWTYPEPIAAVEPITGYVCFFNERVDLEVDGEAQERPRTKWSTDSWVRQASPATLG